MDCLVLVEVALICRLMITHLSRVFINVVAVEGFHVDCVYNYTQLVYI